MSEFNLKVADPRLSEELNASVRVRGVDVPSIEDVKHILLDPNRHPSNYMRSQNQRWNDCNAQSGNNGEEHRDGQHSPGFLEGKRRQVEQRSDAYTYACCELIDTGRVGGNNGSTIGGFVSLITKGVPKFDLQPGIALEKDFPYVRQTNTRQFVQAAKQLELRRTIVTEHAPCLPFAQQVPVMAYGVSCHIGISWPGRGDSAWGSLKGKRLLRSPPRRGVGGHAIEVLWADFIDGKWYLLVWNSHGDEFFYMNETTWNHYVDKQFAPFGGWLLLPDHAEERLLTYSEIRKDFAV